MNTKALTPLLCVCLLPSAFGVAAFAQSTTFTYQGRLDDGGNPAIGIYDLRFALFAAPNAGVQQGAALTNAATSVSNGLFTTTLDFGNQFPGADRWLEIAVRTNGGGAFSTLTPRQPLTPTPYAMFAGKVNASGISGTLAPGNIANGTITTLMLANGAVGSNQLAAGAVTTAALADGAVTGAKVLQAIELLSTVVLINPTPLALDQFGTAVATVGADKILVGASQDDLGATNAGAAHLFDTSGAWLLTLTNPTPAADDAFSFAVGAVGADKLLIGAPQNDTGVLDAGSAYLFNTSGALLLTITNPSPSVDDGFGSAVTALGADRFLISAFRDNPGEGQFGAAYLYDLTGKLVSSFTNPVPAKLDLFGTAVAAVGTDKVLIGASLADRGAVNAGAAYLFNTNGVLLDKFANPAPAPSDSFGEAVAAVGPDRVLIGAPGDDAGATDAGVAYLFDLNGTRLTTFTNPAPSSGDRFGSSLAAVGVDKVLIGAKVDDTGAFNAGTAYLFDLSGSLLLTITNPAPGASDQFGAALAAFDDNRILIGTVQDDLGVSDAGGAYLLTMDRFTSGLMADAVRFAGVNSASLADGAVASTKIADGGVTAIDLDPALLSNTFWRLGGNSGINAATDFLGTLDAVPLVLRANNREALQLDASSGGTRFIIGTANALDASSTNSSILGGRGNVIAARAPESTIVGGRDNHVLSNQLSAFIGGGSRNTILRGSQHAVIVGGRDNRIGTNTAISLVVGGGDNVMRDNVEGGLMVGGFRNDLLGSMNPSRRAIAPVLVGGSDNEIGLESSWAIILGGDRNVIGTNCASAVLLGGTNNTVADNAGFSLGAGRRARVNHKGAFVWADSQNAPFPSVAVNTFNIRSEGGVHLSDDTSLYCGTVSKQMLNLSGVNYGIGVQSSNVYFRSENGYSWYEGGTHSNIPNSPGTGGTEQMRLNSGGLRVNGTFVSASDRNVKAGFTTVNPLEILAKVAALPITRWHYTNDAATPHLGPVAQDFHAAFGVGPDDKHIATVDADGVALAAIQGLNEKVEVRRQKAEASIRGLRAENAELKQRLEKLERLMNRENGGAR